MSLKEFRDADVSVVFESWIEARKKRDRLRTVIAQLRRALAKNEPDLAAAEKRMCEVESELRLRGLNEDLHELEEKRRALMVATSSAAVRLHQERLLRKGDR